MWLKVTEERFVNMALVYDVAVGRDKFDSSLPKVTLFTTAAGERGVLYFTGADAEKVLAWLRANVVNAK
jgi:hypothetical protein